jgi:cobalt transporter subunit CbtB
MANLAAPRTQPAPVRIPMREIVPWAVFAAVLGLLVIYFVGAEEGITSLFGSESGPVHEFVHDGRHLLGFPCH